MNVRRSYLHLSHFEGEAILGANSLVSYCFLTSCFSHKNVTTMISDLHYSLNCVFAHWLSVALKRVIR